MSSLSSESCHHCGDPALPFQSHCAACDTPLEWSLVAACSECQTEVDHVADSCPECESALSIWEAIAATIQGEVTDAIVSKELNDPTVAGFIEHYGSLKGQNEDFRLPLPSGGDIHVREYDDRYEVHWDRVSAVERPVSHLLTHTPHYVLCGVGICLLAVTRTGRGRSALSRVDRPRPEIGRPFGGDRIPDVSNRLPSVGPPGKFW